MAILAWMHLATPALRHSSVGKPAPDFTTTASLAGKPFEFHLAEALKTGPVVLYFYPAAFTKGCTVEAHLFAEATDDFAALGATVIGVSKDDIDTLHKFSVSECRSKFAVAADPDLKIARSLRRQAAADRRRRPHLVRDPAGRDDRLRALGNVAGRPRQEPRSPRSATGRPLSRNERRRAVLRAVTVSAMFRAVAGGARSLRHRRPSSRTGVRGHPP